MKGKRNTMKNTHDLTELRKGDQVTLQPYGKNQDWEKGNCNRKVGISVIHDQTGKLKKTSEK